MITTKANNYWKKNTLSIDSEEDKSDEDLKVIEACKSTSKGKGKFRGKFPLICFSCEEVGHIVARCPNKEDKY